MKGRSLLFPFLKFSVYILVYTSIFSQNITITGKVINPADKPVKKAIVNLLNLKDEIVMEDITNRKGEFELEDVEPKFYYLVVDHEGDGSKRIKLNPRKNQNNDLDLVIYLNGEYQPVECFLFGDDPPTTFDPILNVKELEIKTSPAQISISWNDIRQAKLYTLFENGKKIYVGEDTRYEKEIPPGIEYCYTVQASGNYDLKGELSTSFCASAPTQSPRDVIIDIYKNDLSLVWGQVDGAIAYLIYRDNEMIGEVSTTSFKDSGLEFGKEYYYKISALDALKIESQTSVEVKTKTHEFVDVPILSSMNSKTNITLIWNEVNGAITYNIFRNGENVSNTNNTSFTDAMPPGKEYCYQISCIDQYDIEGQLSQQHCTKVPLSPPSGLQANAGVSSMNLYWDEVIGADSYMIYEKLGQDSISYKGESRSTQFTVNSLDFAADLCFVVTSIDMDGQESEFSLPACNIVLDPPHFTVQSMTLNEPSGNDVLDARESGSMQFAIFNDGQSPAHQVVASVLQKDPDPFLLIGKPIILDTLEAGRIKFVKIDIKGLLQLKTGEHDLELKLSSIEDIMLDEPYSFIIESRSMVPPKMIVADFAVSNEFNTHYMPKNEIVDLTVRIQNVGEGDTESVSLNVKKNRTYSTPDFTGKMTLPAFNSGDYMDIEIPIITSEENCTVTIELIDYLGRKAEQRINLETMRNYRSPLELTIQDIGSEDVEYYPDELGEIDVDRQIPLGRKNPNGIAIILGTQDYEDKNYPSLKYVVRDRDVIRKYFSKSFGLSDFQMLPSKPWQMEGGPSGEEYEMIFDPYQGDLRKRVISAEKYSDMEDINIYVYYRGYGEWVNGKPLLIPKDAKLDRHVTKFPLEQMVNNLSTLSVLGSIKTITLFLDITYVNPEESAGLLWDFPEMSEKICILNACSNGETSQIFNEKKHSFFTYSLLKGLSGSADDENNIIDLGEITEYVYKSIPEYVRTQPGALRQNPKFNGTDLKRIVLDLR